MEDGYGLDYSGRLLTLFFCGEEDQWDTALVLYVLPIGVFVFKVWVYVEGWRPDSVYIWEVR